MSDAADRDSLPADLREHIFRTHAATPATERKLSRWVMNLEWFNEIRSMDDSPGCLYHPGLTISTPETMLGLPIEIRADGGPPHLER